MRGTEKGNVSEAVDPPTWVSDFQILNKPKKKKKYQQFNTTIKYSELKKRKMYYRKLDNHISIAEILSAF